VTSVNTIEDVRNLEEVVAPSAFDDIPNVNLIYEYSIESTQAKASIESKLLIPDNVFKGLKYSDNNRNVCHGTVAFKCRKYCNEKIGRSTCPICRDDWNGIHKNTYTYKNTIIWRYGEEIGKQMIKKSESPVFYYRHMLRVEVHSAHYQQVVCPKCNADQSYLTISDTHVCNKNNKLVTDTKTDGIAYLPYDSYIKKHVVLTFSRCSGGIMNTLKIISEHDKKYQHCVDHIPRLYSHTSVKDTIHGQRYHKNGQCRTTIINSNGTSFGLKAFSHIEHDINVIFSGATAIYLMMRVTSDMCSSPFYIQQFLKCITYPLSRIYIVLLNYKDEGRKNEDKIRITIPASDIMQLCKPDSLYPFHFFGDEHDTNAILNMVGHDTKVSWKYFESLLRLHEDREKVAKPGRNFM
jgi:hypothetical protein